MYMTRRNHKVDIISYLAGIDYVSEVKEEWKIEHLMFFF
jgi:hypothetical protein